MRGNRTLIIVAVLLLLVALAGAFIWFRGGIDGLMGGADEEVEGTTPTPEVTQIEIVIAAQNIGAGQPIEVAESAVVLQPWPEDALPMDYYDDLEQIDGKYARVDIPRGMPVLPSMLGEPGGKLSVNGSSAALFGDAGRRAYSILFDAQGSVAWAVEPGDHVDILASLNLVPVDEEFQTQLPNQFVPLDQVGGVQSEEGQTTGGLPPGQPGTYGRFESLPGGEDAFIVPNQAGLEKGFFSEYLIVQMTVQDAIVWNVGIWGDDQDEQEAGGVAVQAPAEDEEGGGVLGASEQPAQQPVAPATLETPGNDYITLLVTPQDALVLKYLSEMGANLDLALRSVGDEAPIITEPVWLRYVLDKYQVPGTSPELPIRMEQKDLLPTPTTQAPPTPVEE